MVVVMVVMAIPSPMVVMVMPAPVVMVVMVVVILSDLHWPLGAGLFLLRPQDPGSIWDGFQQLCVRGCRRNACCSRGWRRRLRTSGHRECRSAPNESHNRFVHGLLLTG